MQTDRVRTVHDLSLSTAQKLIAKGLDLAAERNLKLAVSIVDRAGNLLAFARMDGAPIVTIDVAIGKARTAAFLHAPSKVFEDTINAGKPSLATTPGLVPLQGGMPIVLNDEVVGTVSISGSSGETDQAVATAITASFPTL
jgi:glc operon protein GlcG